MAEDDKGFDGSVQEVANENPNNPVFIDDIPEED